MFCLLDLQVLYLLLHQLGRWVVLKGLRVGWLKCEVEELLEVVGLLGLDDSSALSHVGQSSFGVVVLSMSCMVVFEGKPFSAVGLGMIYKCCTLGPYSFYKFYSVLGLVQRPLPPLFLMFASILSGNFIGRAIEFNLVFNQPSVWSILTFEEEVEECPGARVVIHIGRGAEVFSRGSVSKWVEVVRVDSAPDPTSSWTTIGPHL